MGAVAPPVNGKGFDPTPPQAGDGDGGGGDSDGRTFPAHPGPIPKACRDQISRKGNPLTLICLLGDVQRLKNKKFSEWPCLAGKLIRHPIGICSTYLGLSTGHIVNKTEK